MLKNFLLLILALSVAFIFFGCEGPEGPMGEAGPQGESESQYTYMGTPEGECAMCHEDILASWSDTHHPHAWDDLVADGSEGNLYCVQCHVTGFDAEVAYGDSVVTTPGPNLDGWDDYLGVGTEEADARMAALEGVQCESCHGPVGPNAGSKSATVTYTTRVIDGEESSMCAKCHGQVAEWHESGHGSVLETHEMTIADFSDDWDSGSCSWCHQAEGFVQEFDADHMNDELPATRSLIGCQTCHDPHGATNDAQLRTVEAQTTLCDIFAVADGYDAEHDKGNSNLCATCHHSRRDSDHVLGQIDNGYAHFGPHSSPQMDMVMGAGSYEIAGYDYEREHAHIANSTCVSCHMTTIPHGEVGGPKRGHDFEVDVSLACDNAFCHSGATTPDINGFQTEIQTKLDELIALIGVDPDDLGDPAITTPEQRMAGYAYVFVLNDGSLGVHNPDYALTLLDNAIAFMTP